MIRRKCISLFAGRLCHDDTSLPCPEKEEGQHCFNAVWHLAVKHGIDASVKKPGYRKWIPWIAKAAGAEQYLYLEVGDLIGMQFDHVTILLLLDSSLYGGIETHVETLAQGLVSLGADVEVCFLTPFNSIPLAEKLTQKGVPFDKLTGGVKGLRSKIQRVRESGKTPIIHTHGYKAGIFGKLVSRLDDVCCVSTYHSGEPGPGFVRFYNLLDGLLSRLAIPLAVSEQIASRIWWDSNVRVVENFVPVDADTPLPTSFSAPLKIIFAGRLSHEKGPDLFIEVVRVAIEKLPADSVEFHMYGGGDGAALKQQAADLPLVFHGHANDMEQVWQEADLLVMSSRNEGLPMAALEAMAHGVPVAAFAVGGLCRLVKDGETGFLAAPENVTMLADRICHWVAMNDEEKWRMSVNACQVIVDQYSLKAGLEKILDIYQLCLGKQ